MTPGEPTRAQKKVSTATLSPPDGWVQRGALKGIDAQSPDRMIIGQQVQVDDGPAALGADH
jgi:hypothetical protein